MTVAMQKAETHVGKVKKEDQVKGPKSYQRSVLEHLTSRKKNCWISRKNKIDIIIVGIRGLSGIKKISCEAWLMV
jgi:hypothetical protein